MNNDKLAETKTRSNGKMEKTRGIKKEILNKNIESKKVSYFDQNIKNKVNIKLDFDEFEDQKDSICPKKLLLKKRKNDNPLEKSDIKSNGFHAFSAIKSSENLINNINVQHNPNFGNIKDDHIGHIGDYTNLETNINIGGNKPSGNTASGTNSTLSNTDSNKSIFSLTFSYKSRNESISDF
jgi:hypothetical protein